MWGVLPARGELAVSTMLRARAYAASDPLSDRLFPAGALHPSAAHWSVTFLYGALDWMDPSHGANVVERMRALGKADAAIGITPRVGHQFFVEAPLEWARAILNAIGAIAPEPLL